MVKAKSNLQKKKAGYSLPRSYLHIRFDSSLPQSVPDVGSFYYHEFRERIEEIRSDAKGLVESATLAFRSVLKSKTKMELAKEKRISAVEIAVILKSQSNRRLADSLKTNPWKHPARLAIAVNLLNAVSSLSLEQTRIMMMQMAIPIGLGHFHIDNIQKLNRALGVYQKKLLQRYNNDIEKARKFLNEDSPTALKDQHVNLVERLEGNRNLLTRIVKMKEEEAFPIYKKYLTTMNIEALENAIEGTMKLSGNESIEEHRQVLEKRFLMVIFSLIDVDFLHPELLILAEKMTALRAKSPIPDYVKACIWMRKLKISVFQHELGFPNMQPLVQDRLKKSLAFLGNSLKLITSGSRITPLYQQIYLEHASACLYTYKIRQVIGIPPTVIQKLIETGFRSLERSKLRLVADKNKLFERYAKARHEMNLT